ncbi:hypothetical protein [Streptomyces albogriseolus]|uniref:hypothetical protein n=1 Tax=Streptomyces albogriseolus TaxID=1887 RepID=UPI0034614E70
MPGGAQDIGESPTQWAVRKYEEETGDLAGSPASSAATPTRTASSTCSGRAWRSSPAPSSSTATTCC